MSLATFNSIIAAITAGIAALIGALAIWGVTMIKHAQDRAEEAHKVKLAMAAMERMLQNSQTAVKAVEQMYGDTIPGTEKARLALTIANQLNASTGALSIPMPNNLPATPTILNEAHVHDLPKEPKGEG